MNYNKLKNEEILSNLNTRIEGLNTKEINKLQKENGKNVLPKEKKPSTLMIFLSEFMDSIVILMVVAATFSFVIGETLDGFAIIFIILVDAIMGTVQEVKAGKSAEALENLIKVKTKVIRETKEEEINAEDLVVGDIVLLESGNIISADLVILESKNLTVNESILTGESLNIVKSVNEDKLLYAGTSVITGRATAVVIGIGLNTEVGKIANKVTETKGSKSPLTIRMEKFTKQITILIVITAIIITLVLILKQFPATEIFLSVVALSVSAMPEGLPLALTLALTIASNRMAKKNVIVKKLNSVESLGSCTVIASDKTGTLTVNEQTAKKILLPDDSTYLIEGTGYNDKGKITPIGNAKIENAYEISKLGVINNEAVFEKHNNEWEQFGDSIDIAFLALGKKLKVDISKIEELGEIAYESENKYSAFFYRENNENICTIKGSLEKVFEFCNSMLINGKKVKLDKDKIIEQNTLLAKDGYRVIALAKGTFTDKETELTEKNIKDLTFIGLVAFIDPIRVETIESINDCKKAGIKVIMVTGDHPLTAFSIARELNIASSFDEVATGEDVDRYFKADQEKFDKFVHKIKVFSRVTPIQKLEIVESLKRQGEFVAVTGDGVNDAPAIKSANIGIAMGNGTDVAKETSTMIITDNNFLSIVEGIKEGRNAYSNIRKVIYMLLSCGIAEVLFYLLSIALDLPIPLLAIQLLWLNLVTDGLQDIALSFEKEGKDIMKNKPRSPKESIFDKLLLQETTLAGISIGILVFGLWYILIKKANMEVTTARGYVMALMVFIQNIHVLNCRNEKESTFKLSLLNNPLMIVTIVGSIILQIIVMEVPIFSKFLSTVSIPFTDVIMLFILAMPILIVMEAFKLVKREKEKN